MAGMGVKAICKYWHGVYGCDPKMQCKSRESFHVSTTCCLHDGSFGITHHVEQFPILPTFPRNVLPLSSGWMNLVQMVPVLSTYKVQAPNKHQEFQSC